MKFWVFYRCFFYIFVIIITTTMNKIHEGKNIRRIRETLDMKQDLLADKLGKDWNQQKISLLEAKEVIDPKVLVEVSKALGVSPEAIKNFSEEAAVNYINSFNDNSVNYAPVGCTNNFCTFNTADKLVEVLQQEINKKDALIEKLLEKIGK
ncbi:Helix-turn-helix domain-containing protein [Chitinophaga sp. YR573]|nr:Helix-turn-helix domain-containing protein [Chitinophaga sp. YR573]